MIFGRKVTKQYKGKLQTIIEDRSWMFHIELTPED